MCILHNTHTYTVTIVLGDLCDNIGLVGVSAKWSYITASPSHHDQAIPILSPLLFLHVGHPYIYIPVFKIRRIFDLLVCIKMHVYTKVYHVWHMPICIPIIMYGPRLVLQELQCCLHHQNYRYLSFHHF